MRKFIVIKKDQFEDYPESSILRAEDYKTILNAEAIVSEAHQQAEAIIAEARANAQSITDEAREQGVEEAKAQMSETMLNTIISCQEFLSKSSIYLHKTVTDTVKKILSHYEKHEMTLNMINVALAKHRCVKILLKVHPSSFEHISSKLAEFKMLHPSILDIKVIKDEHMEEIGCILETDIGNVQATLSAQLKALENIYLLPMNPAIIQAVVEKAPEKLEQAQRFFEEAKKSNQDSIETKEDSTTDEILESDIEEVEEIKTDEVAEEAETDEVAEEAETDEVAEEAKTDEVAEEAKTDETIENQVKGIEEPKDKGGENEEIKKT